jgi:O-antigen/teichoic acid export membrane protein
MLTSAITAAITAVLSWLGVPPGPYIAGVWIAVKLLLVGLVTLLGWRSARRRRHAQPPPTGGG